MGLTGPRMLQTWENGFSLPPAKRLQRLLEIFHERLAFSPDQEVEEAARLWQSVKTTFEVEDTNLRGYPNFDAGWFIEKVLKLEKMALPALATSKNVPLMGRQEELAELRDLLVKERVPLICMWGLGGVGKTRLARELISTLSPFFADGIHFIGLETLDNPAFLLATIARSLNLPLTENTDPFEILKAYLGNRELLLILDNFEHLLTASSLVQSLLENSPHLQLLITSREALRLPQERIFSLAPLPAPLPEGEDSLANNPAIMLFFAYAQQAEPSFKLKTGNLSVIAQICLKLDNLPLAIELAASRVGVLSVEQINERLNNALRLLNSPRHSIFPERHKSLRATLEWSYQLLQPADRQLLAYLALFRNGCTAEAAEVITDLDTYQVLDGLGALYNQNLIMRLQEGESPVRFTMLQVIREFALQKFAAEPQNEAAESRFINFYLQLVEEIEPNIQGEKEKANLDRLELEYPNIREALSRAINRGDTNLALRLGGAIWIFWWRRGYVTEGRTLLEQALRLSDATPSTLGKARALNAAGNLADIQGDITSAKDYFEKSLSVYGELVDLRGQSNALNNLGNLYSVLGEYELSRSCLEKALELRVKIGNPQLIAVALHNLGRLARLTGDNINGRKYYEQALQYFRQSGENSSLLAQLLANLANLSLDLDDLAAAQQYGEESLELARFQNNKTIQIYALQALAEIALDRKDWSTAYQNYKLGSEMATAIDDHMCMGITLNGLGRAHTELGDFENGARCFLQSRKLFETIQSKEGILNVLINQAYLLYRQGEPQRALKRLEFLQKQAEKWHTPLGPRNRREIENLIAYCSNSG
ncbi:MAG: hypothetical protein BGO39_15880 [Chloroflexi bacterium 54-19]|nr:MAG: hypothetical protein BGO39_15880 [Chloroflexi bacterium 54-19]